MADSIDQMLAQVRKAKEQGADLVEIRLDYVKNFTPNGDLEDLVKQSVLPTLITYRFCINLDAVDELAENLREEDLSHQHQQGY
ncbi:hypothetical protein V2J09_008003 [Rumex salicifolius]